MFFLVEMRISTNFEILEKAVDKKEGIDYHKNVNAYNYLESMRISLPGTAC